MTSVAIRELFQIQSRFLRSAHLERDFGDPKALRGYVVTPEMSEFLQRLAGGLAMKSGRRAWRITGDFGSGKSCFALVMAHMFSEGATNLPPTIRQAVNFKEIGIARPRLLPILITGSREPIAAALLRALHRDLANACGRGRPPAVLERIIKATEGEITDDSVLTLIQEVNDYLISSGKASGLLIILDELGKFLEYAALHPDRQDVFLMQRLAEMASRSGSTPLFVVGLLHQGFGAYADHLSQTAQREWEKVAGRFDEIVFDQPLEHTAGLVADALNIRLAGLPRTIAKCARSDMQSTLNLGWYGSAGIKETLLSDAVRFYPLHPTVLPVLIHIFRRFGQGQRSLFTFLLSMDPFSLMEFAQAPVTSGESYRLHHLYDYVRATFGHRLSVQSYRSHWNYIESLIESLTSTDTIELRVLKSVGLLNLIDSNLIATEQVIVLAVSGEVEGVSASRVRRAIKKLHTEKRLLYYRGSSGGYCLWPHTSVNLERAYEESIRALGTPQRVTPLIESYLATRAVVARRHYIETGNLRHFEVVFAPVENLADSIQFSYDDSDGCIVIALCETVEEYQEALRFADSGIVEKLPDVLLAVARPLTVLGKLVQELQRWEWVAANTPELNSDELAREEVTRQTANARQTLEKRIQSLIGLQQFVGESELLWFRQGRSLDIHNSRELFEKVSQICDEVYALAPKVHNELINRRNPSAAANGARTRLLEGMFGASTQPYLGMNPEQNPPEMAMYISILKKGRLHREVRGQFRLTEPERMRDVCRIRPAMRRMQEILEARADSRIRLTDLMAELRRPPFGMRDGLSPILIALFAVINEQHIAFYDEGKFMQEMVGLDIKRLTKVPELFEIQYCKIAGVRSELFKRMLSLLEAEAPETLAELDGNRTAKKPNVLDIVRPLCLFAARLPPHVHKTNRLSSTSLAVRRALLGARDPAMLLFRDLPVACGFDVITAKSKPNLVAAFTDTLRSAIEELRQVYVTLQDRIEKAFLDLFGFTGSFAAAREAASRRALNVLPFVTEPRLKAFCLRLADLSLNDAKWLESLGSFVCLVPPTKWTDLDVERFFQELNLLVGTLKRVEAIAFQNKNRANTDLSVRVAITNLDGTEREAVIFIAKDEESRIAQVAAEISKLIKRTKQVGLAGAARAFWTMLPDESGRRD
ncbi:MAG TPA: hypothetical protein VFI24_10135 [Pyrinomonadaceae bacterium]|nr:hypothetical protein [Pyrinomonadaceae bacterium]